MRCARDDDEERERQNAAKRANRQDLKEKARIVLEEDEARRVHKEREEANQQLKTLTPNWLEFALDELRTDTISGKMEETVKSLEYVATLLEDDSTFSPKNPYFISFMKKRRGMKTVVDTMTKFPESCEIAEHGCRCLYVIMYYIGGIHCDAQRKKYLKRLRNTGACKVVLSSFKSFPTYGNVVSSAIGIIERTVFYLREKMLKWPHFSISNIS
jgi:hypothetical protein